MARKSLKTKKTGRRAKRLNSTQLEFVRRALLAENKKESDVIEEMAFTVKQWRQVIEDDASLSDIIDLWKLREEERLVDDLAELKQHGAPARMFLLKSRHGYQDQPKKEKDAPTVNIQVMLPKPAKSDADYKKIIDAEFQPVAPKAITATPSKRNGDDYV